MKRGEEARESDLSVGQFSWAEVGQFKLASKFENSFGYFPMFLTILQTWGILYFRGISSEKVATTWVVPEF